MTTESLIILRMSSPTRWRIGRTEGPILPCKLANYSLVNPSLMDELDEPPNLDSTSFTILPDRTLGVCMPSQDEAVFTTTSIAFVGPPLPPNQKNWTLLAHAPAFIAWLRVLSGQFQISGSPSVVLVRRRPIPNPFQSPPLPNADASFEGFVRAELVQCAATVEQTIEAAHHAQQGETVPIPLHLFVDAIGALQLNDFRLSLLLSAIAVEVLAADYLDREYERRKAGAPGLEIRMRQFSGTSESTTVKDPIYDVLMKRDFPCLLHETPLYLLGRSLLLDNPPLYETMIRLHKTRNAIVHRGDVTRRRSDNCFETTRADAQLALHAVREFFHWAGAEAPPFEPKDFIEVQMATWGRRDILRS